jgi:hypothetical protein
MGNDFFSVMISAIMWPFILITDAIDWIWHKTVKEHYLDHTPPFNAPQLSVNPHTDNEPIYFEMPSWTDISTQFSGIQGCSGFLGSSGPYPSPGPFPTADPRTTFDPISTPALPRYIPQPAPKPKPRKTNIEGDRVISLD